MATSTGINFTVFTGSENGSIVQGTTHRDGLLGDQVLLKITHSGLCATDEHYKHAPMCLGHEGAGVVEQLGPEVKTLKIGENVAFGFQHSSCGICDHCLSGNDLYCAKRVLYGTGNFDIGSMASHAVFSEKFLFQIPAAISNAEAAPLMCSGATAFNIFDMYNIRPTDRVGIVGVGGLGHLAIQFAAKWGCDVVVFSTTDAKKEEAMKLGANEFVVTKGVEKLEVRAPIDHLLVGTPSQVPWNLYLPVMNNAGTIYPLYVDFSDLVIPFPPILLAGLRIQPSIFAPRVVYKRMLEFTARHGIKPMITEYKLNKEGIDKAMVDLKDGKLRYKAVLCADK